MENIIKNVRIHEMNIDHIFRVVHFDFDSTYPGLASSKQVSDRMVLMYLKLKGIDPSEVNGLPISFLGELYNFQNNTDLIKGISVSVGEIIESIKFLGVENFSSELRWFDEFNFSTLEKWQVHYESMLTFIQKPAALTEKTYNVFRIGGLLAKAYTIVDSGMDREDRRIREKMDSWSNFSAEQIASTIIYHFLELQEKITLELRRKVILVAQARLKQLS